MYERTPSLGPLPPQEALRVEALCARFAADWARGRPHIEDYLVDAQAAEYRVLLHELIRLDAEHRRHAGEAVQVADYLARFEGADAAWLDDRLSPAATQAAAPPATASLPTPGERPGLMIAGRYKLLEQIGEGGMGTVWVAEQTEPVRRKVALKLIKLGMDSRSVLARFEAERQALAMMDHPNIAKVLDGGTTDKGRPYFAMEYVKGIPLTKYCDGARLTIAERLQLFVPVCQAVQHAHQKGIIHRDLKPSNILVCLYDGKPVPKVIDFGLAKAMHHSLTEHTLHTAHGTIVGTPLYMSPEQAEFNNLDVDTRTDIYSLGVILYELLTGTTPLERKRLSEAAWQEALRLIKEEEPPRPSTRLSGSHSLPDVAAQRQTEPLKLARLVRGELDWIVMKALEKERSRRYETANGLARDIEHYLADETVEATPPSARYRLRKLVRKYRTGLTVAATILLLLVAGIAVSTWQAIRATLAEDVATEKAKLAQDNEEVAQQQALEAKKQTKLAGDTAEELKYRLALDRILLTQAALDSYNVAVAQERLAEVPPEMRRWEWHYLQRQCEGGLFTLRGHTKHVWSVAVSPDGTRLATGSTDRTAKIWDARTGTLLVECKGHTDLIWSVAFSPDGLRLATASFDKTAKVWDARLGTLLVELRGHSSDVTSVAFSPDGTQLATASGDHTAKIWEAQTGKPLFALTGHTDGVMSVAFSPDGTHLATGSFDSTARLWEARTGRFLMELPGHTNGVRGVAFSPDGTRLATASNDSTAKIWDARTGTPLAEFKGHKDFLWSVAFSPDGLRLATGSYDRTARIWEARTGTLLVELKGHTEGVTDAVFTADGLRVATVSMDRTAKVWDAQFGTALVELKGHREILRTLAFSPDGTRLATGSDDRTAKIWETRTGALLLDLKGHTGLVWTVAFSPDGTRLATGSFDGTARIWDAQTGESLVKLKGSAEFMACVAFSPDGTRLATASADKVVKVWDAQTGVPLMELKGLSDAVRCVSFSPDGTRLATASDDKTVKIWDARLGTPLLELRGHTGAVLTLAYSPDEWRLATGDIDGTVRVWDVQTGNLLLTLKGHTDHVGNVAFSPDGTRLATASNPAKVWDLRTGTPLVEIKWPVIGKNSVAFSADGTRLAAVCDDRTARIWDVRPGESARADERDYRLFWTRPRPERHRVEYFRALRARDDVAARFHRDRLGPHDALFHYTTGQILQELKDLDGASAAYRLAIGQDPKFLKAHEKLILVLADKKDWDGTLAAFQQVLALDPKKNVEVARTLGVQSRSYFAARLLAFAFNSDPTLADDMKLQPRYDAACFAALAGSGKNDAAQLDDQERARWRTQAVAWLRADLSHYAKTMQGEDATARQTVAARLNHWKRDSDLMGIRDREALDRLPAAERETCQALWADVESLLRKAEAK